MFWGIISVLGMVISGLASNAASGQFDLGAAGIRQNSPAQIVAPPPGHAGAANDAAAPAARLNARPELQRPGGDELDFPCGEDLGACCYGDTADPGYEPYQCIGDMTQWDCLYFSDWTNWTEGASCDDPDFSCPRLPIPCWPSGGCDEFIARVQINDIDNRSGCDHYADYSGIRTTVVFGIDYLITVTNGTPYTGDVCSIWVDWNHDREFADEAPELIGDVVAGGEYPPYQMTITVPANGRNGDTRMRIRIDYDNPDPDPCSSTTYGEVEDYTLNVVVAGQVACCNVRSGECRDAVEVPDCVGYGPDWHVHAGQECVALDPPCGDPGCCCDWPEPGEPTPPHQDFRANCGGRFIAGVTGGDCVAEAFAPPCGTWIPTPVLYAPAWEDNEDFRSALSALLGSDVDYWNARAQGTPPLSMMLEYSAVLTWVNYAYADAVGMGNTLADYVEAGGRVILGQWCRQSDQSNSLLGRIMDDPAYCPVLACSTSFGSGAYNMDGVLCPHVGLTGSRVVGPHDAFYLDVVSAVAPSAQIDGTIGDSISAIWNSTCSVWYTPGFTANYAYYGSGDWVTLIANAVLCDCPPGACCNIFTGNCLDDLLPADCAALGYEWRSHQGKRCAELSPPCGDAGACCDVYSGACIDDVLQANCLEMGRQPRVGLACDELTPPCGDPGCCCDSPEPGHPVPPHFAYHANCVGRFVPLGEGEECVPELFEPPCGLLVKVLYCPSNDDNPSFRAALSVLLGGMPVDFWNAYTQGTPTVEQMNEYVALFTWCNYPYEDGVQMGNNLADYVDLGGRVILGQWALSGLSTPSGCGGRILQPEYCPVATMAGWDSGSYMGDGVLCATMGVNSLATEYLDMVTGLQPGAGWDGHIGSSYAAIWNAPMDVWYSPGNLGGTYESGDWAILTYNEIVCGGFWGACCNVFTGECREDYASVDCSTMGAAWRWHCAVGCTDMVPACGDPGACCDIYTGGCLDDVFAALCESLGRASTSGMRCVELDPMCGDPGCCCDQPEPGVVVDPHFAFRANCVGRFIPGAFTLCGDLDQNGVVDMSDYGIFLDAFGKCAAQEGFVAAADLDGDGCVSLSDFQAWRNCYQFQGTECTAGAFDPACGVQELWCESPETTSPPPTVCDQAMTALPLDTRPLYVDVSSVPTPCPIPGAIEFFPALNHRRLGDWTLYDFYYSNGVTAVTLTMPPVVTAVYFYVEANPFTTETFQVLINGSVLCNEFEASGSAGVRVAVCGAPHSPIQTIELTCTSDADFLIGAFGIACQDVPGACCNEGECQCTNVLASACATNPYHRFEPFTTCDELIPPCGCVRGACCDDATGYCTDIVPQLQCAAPLRFGAGTLCAGLDPCCGCIPQFPCAVDGWIIAAAGESWSFSGNTCGAGSECALRSSEDNYVGIYFWLPGTYLIDLCASPALWDTYLYLGSDCCTNTWSSDDGCAAYSPLSIMQVNITTPGVYVATVEAYSSACGAYTLTVCCPPPPFYGACCDDATGVCADGMWMGTCVGSTMRFVQDAACYELSPVCGNPGACCRPDGVCEDDVFIGACTGGPTPRTLCADLVPPCSPCCDAELTAPGTWSGTTCGMGDDCALRAGEDIIVAVTIPTDGNWRFDLCGSAQWDTYMYLGTACCQSTWYDDDGCSTYSLLSILNQSALPAGTYYVDIEPYSSSSCGAVTLTVSNFEPAERAAEAVEVAPRTLERLQPQVER